MDFNCSHRCRACTGFSTMVWLISTACEHSSVFCAHFFGQWVTTIQGQVTSLCARMSALLINCGTSTPSVSLNPWNRFPCSFLLEFSQMAQISGLGCFSKSSRFIHFFNESSHVHPALKILFPAFGGLQASALAFGMVRLTQCWIPHCWRGFDAVSPLQMSSLLHLHLHT